MVLFLDSSHLEIDDKPKSLESENGYSQKFVEESNVIPQRASPDELMQLLEDDPEIVEEKVKKKESAMTTEGWEAFVASLPLTGDEEVDAEIINFYKAQFGQI